MVFANRVSECSVRPIDLLIRRTLICAVLTGLLALAYFGSVVVLWAVGRALTGQSQSQVVIVVSTLAIAALFVPLRRRVQACIDRRFYRRKYNAARTLTAFSNTVRGEMELRWLAERLTDGVDETLQPESVSLRLRAANAPVRRQLRSLIPTNGHIIKPIPGSVERGRVVDG